LIEVLVVVVVISLLAAIGIPGLLNALDRGKQKRTMSDLRSIATALESYAVDHSRYPDAQGSANLLVQPLAENYMRMVPTTDGWGRAMLYSSLDPQADGAEYILWSLGADGQDDGNDGNAGETTDIDADIVIFDGHFAQWPAGIQR
jgi:general secretion pathway protein G